MSTIQDPQAPASIQGDGAEVFRYGWRYVRRESPDGREEWDQVPLTLEDVLHPEVGDFHVLSDGHNDDCSYLKSVARTLLAGDASAVVLSDCQVAWDVPDLRPHGPDLAVIFGVREQKEWTSFNVAQEGVRPALIIEVTSPDTRKNDIETKVEHYARAGVPHYVIADARERAGKRRIRLIAYRLGPGGYEPQPPDERGRVWLEPLGLWLGVTINLQTEGDRLVLYDPAGQEIGDYSSVSRALAVAVRACAAAEARAAEDRAYAAAEAQARVAAQAHAQAEASLAVAARSRADAEARVAVEERARAEAEAQARVAAQARADALARIAVDARVRAEAEAAARAAAETRTEAEAQARAAAEARIRQLEAELHRLRGDAPDAAG